MWVDILGSYKLWYFTHVLFGDCPSKHLLWRLKQFHKSISSRHKIWKGSIKHYISIYPYFFSFQRMEGGEEFDWFIFYSVHSSTFPFVFWFLFVTFRFHIYDVTTCFSSPSLGIVLENENNTKILSSPPSFALLICIALTTMKEIQRTNDQRKLEHNK